MTVLVLVVGVGGWWLVVGVGVQVIDTFVQYESQFRDKRTGLVEQSKESILLVRQLGRSVGWLVGLFVCLFVCCLVGLGIRTTLPQQSCNISSLADSAARLCLRFSLWERLCVCVVNVVSNCS